MSTTAGATVRHLVSAVFDRALAVEQAAGGEKISGIAPSPPKGVGGGVGELPQLVADAYLLFQDLIQLVNADQPLWLQVIKVTLTCILYSAKSLI